GTFSLQDNLGDQPVETNVQVVSGVPHFFVLGVTFLPGNDVYKLYIDPPAGQPEPATPAASLNFDLQSVPTLGLTGPGAYGFDELRIGTTWNGVTGMPEPATGLICTVAIASVAGYLAVAHRTRKRPDVGRGALGEATAGCSIAVRRRGRASRNLMEHCGDLPNSSHPLYDLSRGCSVN
ncbi:MAG TPA: hypothetical protein VGH32_11285, partial [Pirellulales bacterium]